MKNSDDPFFELPIFTSEPAPPDEVAPISYDRAVAFFEEIIEVYHLRGQPRDGNTPVPARFEM